MAGTIVVTMKGYWLSAGWFRLTARPFVRIDGAEQRVRWGVPHSTDVEAGTHTVAGGIRYPGFSSLMGTRDITVNVAAGQTVSLIARNGLFNSEPFYLSAAR
ncbi:hypothetical protein [Gryllotalpicola kribbensis]|uniref:hypothetical protein n=1 Tax=Gryllotalpicola kribbensis TaxID=993084 RepID=UPI0031E21CD2